jgi:hypothetical protein
MTSTVTIVIMRHIASSAFGALSNGVGVIAVFLLIILLTERVLLEAYGGARATERARAFNSASVSLLIVLVIISVVRFTQILHVL